MLGKNRMIIVGGMAVFFLAALFIVVVSSRFSKQNTLPQESPVPTPFPITANPPAITSLPTQSGTSAIDISAPVVQNSETEVEKISAFIPYLTDIQTPDGMTLSIVIPDKSLQPDPWKLTVQVFGINYNVLPEEPDYEKEKNAFLFGATHVFTWMRQNNVDPEKVIIKWGDRAFIQQKAEEWLKS